MLFKGKYVLQKNKTFLQTLKIVC